MKKNKICVIFTGGTIGSSITDNCVDLDGRSASRLINGYTSKYGDAISFDERKPLNILSENVQTEDTLHKLRYPFLRYDSGYILHRGIGQLHPHRIIQ